jgi:gas vesicle protein
MKHQDWDTDINGGSFVGFFSTMFFAGVATGLIAGLLLAPKTGKESRGMLTERFGSIRDEVTRRGSTNGGELQEESLESALRADYLH